MAIPLQGKFKAQLSTISNILAYSCLVTASGLKPAFWTKWLIDMLEEAEITTGWLFQNLDWLPRKMTSFADQFYAHLIAIQEQDPTLFEPKVNILEDYGLA